ncbi:hypothetical protein SAMN05421882_1002172 [Nitrosomonas communis]|uniref:Uncharacterized protein n=1 Tax=Nitrosomonas communis TaxID=44574 RepID=A0A1H2QMH1_9PROT|nr:hypothetical protein SAMN05421882_1002172 [Nitrosomonas communis]
MAAVQLLALYSQNHTLHSTHLKNPGLIEFYRYCFYNTISDLLLVVLAMADCYHQISITILIRPSTLRIFFNKKQTIGTHQHHNKSIGHQTLTMQSEKISILFCVKRWIDTRKNEVLKFINSIHLRVVNLMILCILYMAHSKVNLFSISMTIFLDNDLC